MSVTIGDVARLAEVSIATVSHTINKTRFVSEELKARVYQAIEELGYMPNTVAQGLRAKKTKMIGLVIPDCTNMYFAEIAQQIDQKGFKLGYNVILCNSDNEAEKQHHYIRLLISKQVDGVILISTDHTEKDIELLEKHNVPTVLVDRNVSSHNVDIIMVDNFKGGHIAAAHLVDCGYVRIGCVTGPANISSSIDRLNGFKEELKSHGLTIPKSYIVRGNFQYSGGKDAFGALMKLPDLPEAIFACNDMMALGCMHAALESGLRIPQDIAIIGYDNIIFNEITFIGLTTIAQPLQKITTQTILYLESRIQDKNIAPRTSIFDPALIVRESCMPIPV
jgi:LacI family transcriptional regulator